MHKNNRRRALVGASIAALFAVLIGLPQAHGQNVNSCPQTLQVHGPTDDGRLVRFTAGSPQTTTTIAAVTGLQNPDTALIGIDYRVQDGLLYGVGNGGGVYRVSTSTAQATFVNSLTIPLSGASFGVDFNPSADRLRVVSDLGQNLRHNVNAGGVTIDDSTLTYTPPPATPVAALGITASAYTNNDLNADTATTLFGIDTNLDQVVIQSPANNGILVATGKLGVDSGLPAGFDIYSRLNGDVTEENCGFAALTAGNASSFYQIDLGTGKATSVAGFDTPVVDIALPLNQQ